MQEQVECECNIFYQLNYNMCRELIHLRLARMKMEYPGGCKYMYVRKRYTRSLIRPLHCYTGLT